MKLVRYNPFNRSTFGPTLWENSFNDFFNDSFFNTSTKTDGTFYPAVDILNEKDDVVLNVELPGVNKEDISIDIEDRILTIKGERKFEHEDKKEHVYRKERSYGCFSRSFSLSDDVLADDVNADFKDGVLKITLKKDTTQQAVKQITIN